MTIYCPVCGSVTQRVGSVLVCALGEMEFSSAVEVTLTQIAEQTPGQTQAVSIKSNAVWYCPADGNPLAKRGGAEVCRLCNRCLPNEVLYQLIEWHTHAQVQGR